MPNNIWDPGNFYPNGTVVNSGDVYYRAIRNVPPGTDITNTDYWAVITNPTTIADKGSTRPKDLEINDAILIQAEAIVPKSGYDTVKFYIVPTTPTGTPANPGTYSADDTLVVVSSSVANQANTPRDFGYTDGYLTGGGTPPNGIPVKGAGIAFPSNAQLGDYWLRQDYFPNRLFRYDGGRWVRIENVTRTDLTPGPDNNTLRSSFVNNTYTVRTTDQGNIPSRQSLSQVLSPDGDNGSQGGDFPPNPYPNTQPGQPSS
jgi:hypothetical protein